MREYLGLAKCILEYREERGDRTGVGTFALFGPQLHFDLRLGFPLLTTKKVWFKAIKAELLWFLAGSTNIQDLHKDGITIWDEWADEDGDLGPVYGHQWRNFGGSIDQIAQLVEGIRTNPQGRRHLVTAWNPCDLEASGLPPCHVLFQAYVSPTPKTKEWEDVTRNGWLDLKVYQRSADLFLGVPFNIASYALLLSMLARVTGYAPRSLYYSLGDVHIYRNHEAQIREQLTREPRTLPRLVLTGPTDTLDGWSLDQIRLERYRPHPALAAPVAV